MGKRALSGRSEKRFINWKREGILGKGTHKREGSGGASAWSVQPMGIEMSTTEWSLGK